MVQIHFELYYHSIHSCTITNMIRGVSRFNMSRATLKNLERKTRDNKRRKDDITES